MEELGVLLLVLGAVYLAECVLWLPRGSAALARRTLRGWRLLFPGRISGNERRGAVLADPLLPAGHVLVVHPWPVSLSPSGVRAGAPHVLEADERPRGDGEFLAYERLGSLAVRGRDLIVDSRVFVSAASPSAARRLADLLGRLGRLPETARARAIEDALASSLDSRVVEERLGVLLARSRSLGRVCGGLLVYLFLLAPIVMRQAGPQRSWKPLLAGLLLLDAAALLLYRRAHRALFPEDREERWASLLAMALSPPAAARAAAHLSRDLLDGVHPLAAARALCSGRIYRELARRVLLDVRHPVRSESLDGDPRAESTSGWFRAALLRALERDLRAAGVDSEALLSPPEPHDPAARAYCPRCRDQFVGGAETCPDCGGLPLVAFPDSRACA
ncbi:MAG: hypothetical protein L0323_13730 [Planctomycetes bacterium]|nr:hypothetical protein [Planctomycetota bacterium]